MRASGLLSLIALLSSVQGISLDINSDTSILAAAKTIVGDILDIYHGNTTDETTELFSPPYYWWETGLAWDSLIYYWWLSGDESIVNTVTNSLLSQIGTNDAFMPANQTKSEGNDDQSIWGLAAMSAAEAGFPGSQNVSWIQLAENVFNTQVNRWDTSSCGGGLRWQIFSFNDGYDFKDATSNGQLIELAARLARFTGNSTYSQWAQRAMDWSTSIGLVDARGDVFDGTSTTDNCSTLNHVQFTMPAGRFLSGASVMENITHSQGGGGAWSDWNSKILSRSLQIFTQSNVLYEVACQPQNNCDTDQLAFKAVLSRALGGTLQLGTGSDAVNSVIQASAKAAAAQCTGGSNGSLCGSHWTNSTWDGTHGLGQELSALEIILALLPGKALRTADSTATTSQSSSNSTSSTSGQANGTATTSPSSSPHTGAAGRGASASLSALIVGVILVGTLWM